MGWGECPHEPVGPWSWIEDEYHPSGSAVSMRSCLTRSRGERRERGAPAHSNIGNHSPNGDWPEVRPRCPFSATSAAPREPRPFCNLATGNWELTTGEIVAAPIRCPLLFPFRDSACFP
jgi:hypothetical protein